MFCLCENYRKNIKEREANHKQKILTRVVFLGMNKLILFVFLTPMLKFKLFDFRYKHAMIILRNDPGLLINGFLKMEFRGNCGVIFDFLGIPNESKS